MKLQKILKGRRPTPTLTSTQPSFGDADSTKGSYPIMGECWSPPNNGSSQKLAGTTNSTTSNTTEATDLRISQPPCSPSLDPVSSSLMKSTETSSNCSIEYPTEHDVIFGRGKPYQSHPGNIRLHRIVDLFKPRYYRARRHEKTEIAEEIVQFIQCCDAPKKAGRFLKRATAVDGAGRWAKVPDIVAREKVSHALRGKPIKNGSNSDTFDNGKNAGKMEFLTYTEAILEDMKNKRVEEEQRAASAAAGACIVNKAEVRNKDESVMHAAKRRKLKDGADIEHLHGHDRKFSNDRAYNELRIVTSPFGSLSVVTPAALPREIPSSCSEQQQYFLNTDSQPKEMPAVVVRHGSNISQAVSSSTALASLDVLALHAILSGHGL